MRADTPSETANRWLLQFGSALAAPDPAAAAGLFAADGFWRDLLAFTWNVKTLEGRDAIHAMLQANLARIGPGAWSLQGEAVETGGIIEAWFLFETALARGIGHLRLKGERCWTLLTTLLELKGFEERHGTTRETGVVHGAFKQRQTWLDRRAAERAAWGKTAQPYCVIIGGGQGGIALGARMKRLGVPTVILEKNARAGDSWRNRYRSLVLHDPVWYDHLPYLPFPDHWPVFTPKDQMGDWLESYVRIMDLDYWTSSTCLRATYDRQRAEWSVLVQREGQQLILRPKQLVFATGSYGPPNEIRLPGSERFAGTQYHSAAHVSGEGFAGKKCVVVGANSSGHDMCADLWEHDADVTMIQRTATTVVRSETLMEEGFEALYSESALARGVTVERADLTFASLPFRLMPGVQIPLYERIARRDADFYARLARSGFRYDFGEDKSGLMMKALRTGSGYYIDVGCSELIASGQVKVKSGVEPVALESRAVVLSDGSRLPADLVIFATGYRPMNEWVARMVSPEAAEAIGPNWGYGSGVRGDPGPWLGELRNMWKPLAHPALWFHGGNLALSRHYSLYVGLQIKARMEGLATPVYGDPDGPGRH